MLQDTSVGKTPHMGFLTFCVFISLYFCPYLRPPLYVRMVIVGNGVPAIPTKLVVEEQVSQEELDYKQQIVRELT